MSEDERHAGPRSPRFTSADLTRAHWDWNCNCGPASLAIILDLTLDEVRPLFNPAFPGYTTPPRMFQALRSAGAPWQVIPTPSTPGGGARLPRWGLCRVQWHGPWTLAGGNQRWAYQHTHWVGAARIDARALVFDINALDVTRDGWLSVADWSSTIARKLTAEIPRATGGWHVTHSIEVDPADEGSIIPAKAPRR